MTVDLSGRVAIVTGAGRGLGRSHALALAERGAHVLVNDLATADDDPAVAVVAEIRERGGEAAASHDSVDTVEGGAAIVTAARERWGRVDVVVNNAGILRDASFHKLEPAQLDAVLRVHLYGAFHVTMAAWPHLREQGYGRVVNTTSGSGLYGNFGQANYAAAKMGLVGLTRTLAVEGQRHGIGCNAIAPLAASRMTADILPPELLARLDPAWVSPLVVHLASETCDATGEIFSVGGGRYTRVALLEGSGVRFDAVPSPEDVAARFDDVRAVDVATEPRSLQDQVRAIAGELDPVVEGE
jgi:NAD(P)-dependent dehydrogenase (short-subunit alcohol dehydrogenase family)